MMVTLLRVSLVAWSPVALVRLASLRAQDPIEPTRRESLVIGSLSTYRRLGSPMGTLEAAACICRLAGANNG